MEWMGESQLRLLAESGGLGLALGLLFDVFSAMARSCRRRWLRFLVDSFFGVPAALLTFFGALAMMDGRMHPLLFGGMAVGFCLEHIAVGRWLARGLFKVGMAFRWGLRWMEKGIFLGEKTILRGFCAMKRRLCRCIFAKKRPFIKKR